ncbi:MAG: amidohydrolase family protein [Clostridia bacterium]|nr:amidohydrolase family protein [Clostridia bacterium]
MIIDVHAHIFPLKLAERAAENIGAFYDIKMAHPGSVPALIDAMDRGGVDKALVHSVAMSKSQVTVINDFIHGEVTASGGRLFGFATLHPDMENACDEVTRALNMGLKGVKIHSDMQRVSLLDQRMNALYEACEGRCPMLLHMGDRRYEYDNPGMIPQILKRFPRLQLICAHMGGYSEWDNAREYLKNENVLFDCSSTSFALGAEGLKDIIRYFGVDRVMFGSDFPMWDPGKEAALVRSLNLGTEATEKIFYKNAQTHLGIK